MPSVPETLAALYAVQKIDTLIQRAKKSQAGLDNGTSSAAAAETANTQAQQKRTELHKLAGDLKDSELKLETVETKRKNYQQKLYQGSITNAKELANIEKEIEALGRQQSDLDGRILALMEEVEQAQAVSAVADAQARTAEGHRTEVLASYRSRYDALALELTALIQQRQDTAILVEDKAALKRYDDIRARSAGIGIAKIEGDTCGGCHMKMGSALIKTVKEAAQIQTCENCGRLLVT
ncbi:MAG: zinc ribbon domain-containing protein [Janthinobacterium lividum]